MQFLLSEIIIISLCKCVNIPVRSPKTRLLPRDFTPWTPTNVSRCTHSRSQGGPQTHLPCLESPHQNYPSYAPDNPYICTQKTVSLGCIRLCDPSNTGFTPHKSNGSGRRHVSNTSSASILSNFSGVRELT